MVIINLLTIFKYSIVYELNNVVSLSETHISADLNSSEVAVATVLLPQYKCTIYFNSYII